MVVAVILAAGESRRMGRPKAFLPIEGQTFIERIVNVFKESKVEKILVVLGHNADETKNQISHLPVSVIVNEDYSKGQLSSLHAAVRSLSGESVDGIVVHLVDQPFVSTEVIDLIIDNFYSSKKLIVLPCYHGRRGHPVLFSKALFPELLNAPLDRGAKTVVHAHPAETLMIEVDDERVTVDLDTPEQYQRYIRMN